MSIIYGIPLTIGRNWANNDKPVIPGEQLTENDFTFTGTYNLRDDGVLELLSDGYLQFTSDLTIDVFLVGGGGGGSAMGQTGSYYYGG